MSFLVTFGRWDVFMLVLVRVAAMVMVAPVLGARPIPAQVKIGLCLFLALLLTPLQPTPEVSLANWQTILVAVPREAVVGLLMGFTAALLFAAVQMAARIVNVQMGFGLSNVMDPLSVETGGSLDSFYTLLAAVIFLTVGGHHALIAGLGQSFEMIPLGEFVPAAGTGNELILLGSAAFSAAVRLALPVAGTLMLADAAMALVVRSIPQMNIFAVGLPVKVAVGMLTLAAVMPMTVVGMSDLSRAIAGAVAGLLP